MYDSKLRLARSKIKNYVGMKHSPNTLKDVLPSPEVFTVSGKGLSDIRCRLQLLNHNTKEHGMIPRSCCYRNFITHLNI